MDLILQPLAILLASLLGLVGSPDLKLRCELRQTASSIEVHAEVEGAVTSQVGEFVLAGNPLTLVFSFRSGGKEVVKTKTIRYQAWTQEFQVFSDQNPSPAVLRDGLQAFLAWRTAEASLPPTGLVSAKAFLQQEKTPAAAAQDIAVLWGYKTVDFHQ